MRRYQLVGPDDTATLTLSRFGETARIIAPANPRPAEELARLSGTLRFEMRNAQGESIGTATGKDTGEAGGVKIALDLSNLPPRPMLKGVKRRRFYND